MCFKIFKTILFVMKVLLCTPYLNEPGIVKGGIHIWAQSILSYADTLHSGEIELIPESFDRHTFLSNGDVSWAYRLYTGLKEVGKSYLRTKKHIKKIRPNLVHICSSASISLIKDILLINCAKKYGAKSILHLHFGRTPELAILNNWEWKLLSTAIKNSDATIVMDKKTYDILIGKGFHNTHYVPNPISNIFYTEAISCSDFHTRDLKKVLFVGHVLRTKGIMELVTACSEIQDISLKIVGPYMPDVKTNIENIARIRNNGNWVEFTGALDHQHVISEFRKAGLFVFPSYTEGFPNVILESMACGCPIAASNVGAIAEMLDIKGNPCGLCFSPRNKDEVKAAILELINNPTKSKQFAELAKKRVVDQYSIKKVWSDLFSIWKNLS